MTLPKGFNVGDNNQKRDSKGYFLISGGIILLVFPLGYFFYWLTKNFLVGIVNPDPLTTFGLLGLSILGTVLGSFAITIGRYQYNSKK